MVIFIVVQRFAFLLLKQFKQDFLFCFKQKHKLTPKFQKTNSKFAFLFPDFQKAKAEMT